jgi:hypothetical protein
MVRGYVVFVLIVWCAALVLLPSSTVAAGRPDGQAIQFGIASYFRLSNFDGATLAYQRFLRRDFAWRLSLGVDLRDDDGEVSEQRTGERAVDGSSDIAEWNHAFSLSSECLAYRGDRVSVYFGGGPRISYSSRQNEGGYFYPEYSRFSRYAEESFGGGLQGCVGIQWVADDWLTIHAEYSVRCMYSHIVEKRTETRTGEGGYKLQ